MKPFIFLLSLAFSQSAIATEIKLLNGDTLNGDVIKTENGQVTLSHPILGLVTIPSSNIKPAVVSEEKIVDKKDNGLLGTGFFKDWKRSAWSLIGRTGLGVSKEFGGDNDDWTPEALLGLESFWAISKHHSVEFKNSLYPNLDKLGEFRNLTELNWKIGLADINNLNLKVGFVNDYDSLANGESQENDFQYRLLLAFDI